MKKNILIFLYFILFTVYSDNAFSENKPPRIISSSFEVDENTNLIGTIEARDRDGDSIQFFSSKPHIISVNKNSGVLRFVKAPNYERNSSYNVKITVSDGENSKSKRIAININNVNEAPEITQKNYTWYLNDTKKLSLAVTDPENDSLAYSISGSDAETFSVSNNGNVRLLAKEGISKKTVFRDLELTVSDGEYSDSRSINLTVVTDFLSLEETIIQTSGCVGMYCGYGSYFGNDIVLDSNGRNLISHSRSLIYQDSSKNNGSISHWSLAQGNWTKNFEIEGSFETAQLGANGMDISSNGKIFAFMTQLDSDPTSHKQKIYAYKYINQLNRFQRMGRGIPIKTEFPGLYSIGDYPMPYNLSLDETGKKLAATNIEYGPSNTICPFRIKTYKFKTDWIQYGEDIDVGNTNCSSTWNHGVNIQDKGRRLIASYNEYDGSSNTINVILKSFAFSDSSWSQVGNTLDPNYIEESIENDLGEIRVVLSKHTLKDFKLSPNGKKLSIFTQYYDYGTERTGKGLFRFYSLIDNEWMLDSYLYIPPCSEDISSVIPSYRCDDDVAGKIQIQSFDVSDDMRTIAFEVQDGWSSYTPRFDGMVVVYRKKGSKWKRYASYICDNDSSSPNSAACANSIEVDKDGSNVFIGSPNYDSPNVGNVGAILELKLNNIN